MDQQSYFATRERFEDQCRSIFETAVKHSPLTTVAQQLFAMARERFPGYELFYNSEPMEECLRFVAARRPPLFILKDFTLMRAGWESVWGHEVDAEAEFPGITEAMGDVEWLVRLAASTNPYARAILEVNPSPVSKALVQVARTAAPSEINQREWPAFIRAALAATCLRWINLPRFDPQANKLMIDNPDGKSSPITSSYFRHNDLWSVQNQGIYTLDVAREIAAGPLRTIWTFTGPAGALAIITHNNAQWSKKWLDGAEKLVKGKPEGSLALRLWSEVVSETKERKVVQREYTGLLVATGVRSTTGIADEWIKFGCVSGSGDGLRESARRQVNFLREDLRDEDDEGTADREET